MHDAITWGTIAMFALAAGLLLYAICVLHDAQKMRDAARQNFIWQQIPAETRIATVHRPYHQALGELMQATRARQGRAVLIDWHSMPARAVGAEVVLGDRYGSACSARLTRRLRDLFEGLGWRVSLNRPYAGGWSTQCWGRPDEGFQAIQIELNRAIYLNEATLEPSSDHARVVRALDRVIAGLCAEVWPR